MIPEHAPSPRDLRSAAIASLLLALAACGSSPTANVIVPGTSDSGMAGMSGGTGSASDAGSSPFDTPSQCSSDTHWTKGNQESPQMHPGRIPCAGASGLKTRPSSDRADLIAAPTRLRAAKVMFSARSRPMRRASG